MVFGKTESGDQFLQKIHMTNECHTHLCGKVNKENYRYWSTTSPSNDLIEKTTIFVRKVTAWIEIGWFGVISSYFLEDPNGNAVTVNLVNCREMTETFYLPQL